MLRGAELIKIKSLVDALANPRVGDWVALDIDNVLLLTSFDKYKDPVMLTESGLTEAIDRLRESRIRVFGVTARKERFREVTIEQLESVGVHLDYVLHAPNRTNDNGEKIYTKGLVLREHVDAALQKPKRLCVVDDMSGQLESIAKSFEDSSVPLVKYHYARPQKQHVTLRRSKKAFPPTLDGFGLKLSLGGGTESTFLLKKSNKLKTSSAYPKNNRKHHRKLVLKLGAHSDGIKVEILCNALYRVMGVNVPDLQVYNALPFHIAERINKLSSPYGIFAVSQYIEKADVEDASSLIEEEARNHFIAHVLLGNIDIAKSDNFVVGDGGKVFLIDAGANFIYRARGGYRKQAHHALSEFKSLRNNEENKTAAEWFGSLTDEELKDQLKIICANIQKIERTIWHVSAQLQLDPELREDFINAFVERLDCLVERYCPEMRAYPNRNKKPREDHTAAGILTFTRRDDRYYVLLAQRVRHDYFANFGGKSDVDDKGLAETAQREVREESGGLLKYTEQALLEAPSHDLMQIKDGYYFSYRMFLIEHDWVDPDRMVEEGDGEHTACVWVPLASLVDVVTGDMGALPFEIYQPLLHMLRQEPVKRNLLRLLYGEQMLMTHTAGTLIPAEGMSERVRPIMTPAILKQQIAETAVNKLDVNAELKSLRPAIELPLRRREGLSQSEIHMKMLLREQYKDGDIKANVTSVINYYFADKLRDPETKSALINDLTALVAAENEDETKIHFIHAVDDKVDFVYDLYSEMFALLRADPAWAALRMSSDKFHRFATIAEFIAHYTIDGELDNYHDDYGDHAISANLFVFGNHNIELSSSIDYLIKNETRTDLSLTDVLKKYFKSFELRKQDIKALKQIYKKYKQDTGGVLYQISIDHGDVINFSYPAGSRGVLNYLGEHKDVCAVLDQLRIEAEEGEFKNRDYVLGLQARVVTKPTLPMSIKRVRLKSSHSKVDAEAYKLAMKSVARVILKAMLRSVNSTNAAAIRADAPVIRRVQECHLQHGLPSAQTTGQRYLLKQILSGDIRLVRDILKKNPDLRFQTLSNLRHAMLLSEKYRSRLENFTDVNELTPFHVMLVVGFSIGDDSDSDDDEEKRPRLDFAALVDAYGDGWPKIAVEFAPNFDDFSALLEGMNDREQASVVEAVDECINSFDRLISVVSNLRATELRLSTLNKYIDLIELENLGELSKFLYSSEKCSFICSYIQHHHTLAETIFVVKDFRVFDREIARILTSKITNFDELIFALKKIPNNFRCLLLENLDKQILFSADADMFKLLSMLPAATPVGGNRFMFYNNLAEDDKKRFITAIVRKVNNVSSLRIAFSSLPAGLWSDLLAQLDYTLFFNAENIIEFLNVLKSCFYDSSRGFIEKLSENDLSCLTELLINKVTNASTLIDILLYFPEDMRLTFVQAIDKKVLLSYIKADWDIRALRSHFPYVEGLYNYLGINAPGEKPSACNDLSLSIAYFNASLSSSQASEMHKNAACQVRDTFYRAGFADANIPAHEIKSLAVKLRFVADALDDDAALSKLIVDMHQRPVVSGQRQVVKMIAGALSAFIAVSLIVAGAVAFVATGGLSAPLSIGAFSIGGNMLMASLSMLAATTLAFSLSAGFFAYDARKQGATLAIDEFVNGVRAI